MMNRLARTHSQSRLPRPPACSRVVALECEEDMGWSEALGLPTPDPESDWHPISGGRERLRCFAGMAVGYNAVLATGLAVLPLGALTVAGIGAFFVAGNMALAQRMGPILD